MKGGRRGIQVKCIECPRGIMGGLEAQQKAEGSSERSVSALP